MRPGLVVLAALLLGLTGAARAAEPAPACPSRTTGVPPDRVAVLARGVNLTGWLDVEDGLAPDPAMLDLLRRRGLAHLRFPVAAERYLPDVVGREMADRHLRQLVAAVDGLLARGFAVSLDMQPGEVLGRWRESEPERARAQIEGLWRRLAPLFAARPPERLFFELLNEPTSAAEYAWILGFARIVRAAAPRHTLVVGPPLWQRIEALEELAPLADRNVVYALHVYDPMAFTHQGSDWLPDSDPLHHFEGVPYPSRPDHPAVRALRERLLARGRSDAAANLAEQMAKPWDSARLEALLARVESWAVRSGAPVIVNEFGVLAAKAPPADRARWIADVRRAAERHCLGWTHWDYADGFGLMRRDESGREHPDPAILDALTAP